MSFVLFVHMHKIKFSARFGRPVLPRDQNRSGGPFLRLWWFAYLSLTIRKESYSKITHKSDYFCNLNYQRLAYNLF